MPEADERAEEAATTDSNALIPPERPDYATVTLLQLGQHLWKDVLGRIIEELRPTAKLWIWLAADGLSHLAFDWLAPILFSNTTFVLFFVNAVNFLVLVFICIGIVAYVGMGVAHLIYAQWSQWFGEEDE